MLVVRKLGLPGWRETAMGALASGGVQALNDKIVRHAGVTPDDIGQVVRAEAAELARRDQERHGQDPDIHVRAQNPTTSTANTPSRARSARTGHRVAAPRYGSVSTLSSPPFWDRLKRAWVSTQHRPV